jgi:hypothetical protein
MLRSRRAAAASIVLEPFHVYLVDESPPSLAVSAGSFLDVKRYLPNPDGFRDAKLYDMTYVFGDPSRFHALRHDDCERARRLLTRTLAKGADVVMELYDDAGGLICLERARLSFVLARDARPLASEEIVSDDDAPDRKQRR